jgi:hypothetical protein
MATLLGMTTRTIVTSQPDVACDVCERRLLRGEQADVFLADGRRRTVCELCAPRAAYEGWLRESDGQALTLPPARPRRGRSFFDRLRLLARPTDVIHQPHPARPASHDADRGHESDSAGVPYDFLDGSGHAGVGAGGDPRTGGDPVPGQAHDGAEVAGDAHGSYLVQALEVFNASEYPRRVAGVARSLGAPEVNVRSAEHLASVVLIVVAWELCWYRYEVDLSEEIPEARGLAQGTELSELDRDERAVNAVAGDSGALALSIA